jgi:hypothetical protein
MKNPLKNLKPRYKVILIILLCILIPWAIFTAIHPTSLPNKLAEKYLLSKVPEGTTMEKAKSIIEKNDWEIKTIGLDNGIYYGRTGQPLMTLFDKSLHPDIKMVGSKFIYAEIDHFYYPLTEYAYAYFIFDENDKLITVDIEKVAGWI